MSKPRRTPGKAKLTYEKSDDADKNMVRTCQQQTQFNEERGPQVDTVREEGANLREPRDKGETQSH